MLQCTMYEETMKIKISGHRDEFERDRIRLCEAVSRADRCYDGAIKAWVIKNPHRYMNVPEIKAALDDRKKQPMMF